jgi:hypothetical protein
VTTLLDAIHRAVVKAFHVPVRDRYQIYQAHPKGFMVMQDTGLNLSRTDQELAVGCETSLCISNQNQKEKQWQTKRQLRPKKNHE